MTAYTTSESIAELAAASVDLLERCQAPSGAFPASPSFPVYRYSWFRDGAFIADALSRAGRVAAASAFFGWCDGVLTARRQRIDGLLAARAAGEAIPAERFLPCRYTLDGEEEPGEWWDFQLDGYGTWLWTVAAHARRHALSLDPWAGGIELSVRYLSAFWDEPCYDWWEEHAAERHVATLAAIVGGLEAVGAAAPAAQAARAAVLERGLREGRLVKWLGGADVDASLIACATPFRLLPPDDPRVAATIRAIERELVHDGGVHRYVTDTYYGGGEWPLLAGLLGWHYLAAGRRDDALAQLHWIAGQARPNGDLPEQSGHLLAPEREREWIERWGPSASPLLWSHAMFVTLAVELGVLP